VGRVHRRLGPAGACYLLIKIAVEDGVPPAFVAWMRVALGGVVLLGLASDPAYLTRCMALRSNATERAGGRRLAGLVIGLAGVVARRNRRRGTGRRAHFGAAR
jgi:hypothetical protein